MSIDYSTWSLAIHGPVFAAALGASLGVVQSRFGAEHLRDLAKLRPQLLKSIRWSLAGHLRPLVDRTRAQKIYSPDGKEIEVPLSDEKLEDALRDFVKSQSQGILDLYAMQTTYDCLGRALSVFRALAMVTAVFSGFGALVALLLKGDAFDLDVVWPHFAGFAVIALSSAAALCSLFRILHILGRTDRLVSKYADLP